MPIKTNEKGFVTLSCRDGWLHFKTGGNSVEIEMVDRQTDNALCFYEVDKHDLLEAIKIIAGRK